MFSYIPDSDTRHSQWDTFQGNVLTNRNDEPLDTIASRYLGLIYSETWEVIFGHFLSRFSCPFTFGDENVSERMVSIRTLCTQLDRWMADSTSATSPRTYTEQFDLSIGDESDCQTEEFLNSVIRAYAARWLPLAAPGAKPQELQQMIIRLWREARRNMLKVINRPSYRSMLTLYLFGLTPIPEGISEEEEHDGLSGHVCVQAALQQVYMLRVRQKSLQFNGSKMSPTVTMKNIALGPDPMATSSFLNAESIAHWAALTFDTSASMTLSARPILSSGLFGYEDDWCWCLVRSCTEMFQATRKEWYAAGMEITESKANQLVASGSAFKLLMWKLAAVFREALRDGHDEQVLKKVYDSIIDGVDQFNRTYRDLLEACQKRIHFLSQDTKFRWYVLMLHYNLSILLVIDAIEGTQRHDLLPPLTSAKTDAENSMINTLAFGLETMYSITLPCTTSLGGTSTRDDRITVPLLAVEPYPHHVVAAVQLMLRAIQRDRAAEKIGSDTYANLASILHRVLRLLPDSSKSVQAARKLADTRAEVT
ncbi:hypothetical protein Slin15195_G056210 [Septoria linicola]|uniref:Uncharacterized protein n=1 Tax=Septoria linicola TaxID=215465 RepID=A0A9Q9AUM4_9PEZI|nr:hypothetical protein Slin14017_G072090 [Septoria linicola]USW52302.1 hypothetical protein Slin15195_G056210 [Septoria linicola]